MYEYTAKMIKVVDGDTMDFEIDLGFKIKHEIRIRLKGIDTPELYKPRNAREKEHARQATQHVVINFLGKVGKLVTYKDKKGKYGRYLAEFVVEWGGSPCALSDSLRRHGFEKRDDYG